MANNRNNIIPLLHGATTPSGPGPPHCQGFTITDTAHSVGLLWMSDQPVAETSTGQLITLTETSTLPVGF